MKTVVKLDQVTKTYGSSRGVENISVEIKQGTIFGFLGPNGAGKTTTISMLVDLIRPTSGRISIFGLDSVNDGVEIRKRIGFLAGDFALDKNLTGWQQLKYFGNLRGDFRGQKVRELAKRLSCELDRPIKTLSRGNRQKVGLISALMNDPELLIFDEPTSGLDPIIQAEFNKIIAEHQKTGKTAFISSHALGEVQTLCDQMAFIREGELVAIKTLGELSDANTKHVNVVTQDKKLLSALEGLENVSVQSRETGHITFTVSGDINPVLALLGRYKVRDVTISEADLETIFMQYYQEKPNV